MSTLAAATLASAARYSEYVAFRVTPLSVTVHSPLPVRVIEDELANTGPEMRNPAQARATLRRLSQLARKANILLSSLLDVASDPDDFQVAASEMSDL